jgi:hypothetical protein
MQKQVYQALERMDRPYLKKGVPGNTKNVGPLADYGVAQDLGFKVDHPEKENTYIEEKLSNKHRWVNNSPFY